MSDFNPLHMVHPGPVHPDRIEWARGQLVHLKSKKPVNRTSLRDAVAALVDQTGLTSGTGRFTGSFSRFRFTTGGPARDGKAANYTFIRDVDAPSGPVDVRFTVGLNGDGGCHVHAHARFQSPLGDGEQGGHLFPEDCLIEDGDLLEVCLVDGLLLRQQQDPETLHSVFEIETGGSTGNGVFVRIRPNEDLTVSLSQLLSRLDYMEAHTVNSIGSLNAPTFALPGKIKKHVTSVGMEITSMDARWSRRGGCAIDCSAVDEAGKLHRGLLADRLAPICVTAEVLLELKS